MGWLNQALQSNRSQDKGMREKEEIREGREEVMDPNKPFNLIEAKGKGNGKGVGREEVSCSNQIQRDKKEKTKKEIRRENGLVGPKSSV